MFCPIRNKDCSRDCIWFRSMSREYTGRVDIVKVEGCAINLILDELSNHSVQNSMQHKEMGEVKNNVVYTALALIGNEQGNKMICDRAKNLLEGKDK